MTPDQINTLLGSIPIPLVLIGQDERVLAANVHAAALFGRGAAGRHYITVLRQPAPLDCVESALKTGKAAKGRFLTRDATRDATYQVQAEPLAADGLRGVMLSLEDVSHVEAASAMRRDFVANVSHELRTPLTALMGFIDTLNGPARKDPVAQERFLGIMAREAARMNRLIKDLLSLSRVEAEERMRPSARVDVAGLITSASMTLGPLAVENGVTLQVTGADATIAVPGDGDQVLQVFTNLLENAIKYGGRHVWVDLTEQDIDPALRVPTVRIEVRDDGEGIDPIHVPRLTERFYRVDSHRSREMGGTGLGLAIVKHIVNRHRGRLRIISAPGQGSRFIVVLPK
jgi:two-component system phosphate regulon sensor histidine kinase PhoR